MLSSRIAYLTYGNPLYETYNNRAYYEPVHISKLLKSRSQTFTAARDLTFQMRRLMLHICN